MKRKFATYPDWQHVLARGFSAIAVESPTFSGTVALLTFQSVGEQGWLDYPGGRLLIADDGYQWLQHFPPGAKHVITATFDAQGRFVYWYIDIVKEHGLDAEGIPWYDDLYLDIVILPDGTTHVLDADELDEALADSKITTEEWQIAWDETNRLLALLAHGPLPPMALREAHLAHLRALPMQLFTRERPQGGTAG